MASNMFIFDWGRGTNISSNLPMWAQDRTLFVGQYHSPAGHQTSFVARAGGSGKLTNSFARALCRAAMIANGCDADGFGSNAQFSIAEMTLSVNFEGTVVGPGEIASVIYEKASGKFYAEKGGAALDGSSEPAPFILAMWGTLMQDNMFSSKFNQFAQSTDDDEKKSIACFLCDMLYEQIKTGSVKLCESSQVANLTATRRQGPKFRPDTYVGKFTKFQVTNRSSKKGANAHKSRAMDTSKFVGSFAFRTEPLTAEQEARVPKLDEKYIVTDELLLVCKHIKETTKKTRPIRNILYRGAPGVGKSESYVGIAAGCHLPLYTFAANALTEPFDLFGQFVPVDENGNQVGDKIPVEKVLSGMPSAEEISMDPGFAYQQITGIPKKDATPTECMAAMFNLAQKSLDVNGGQQRFKFAPGQLIYALRDGGVWGFDEVTLPQNPGVVPALNPAMDSTQSITLPTGEVIHRHPDCIIVGTTNVDLEGCRNMNRATRS